MDSPSPQRFHLFGYPIAHSAAPAFHNECFSALGAPHRFACWSTSAVTPEMLAEIRSDAAGGAAVTMPLKTAVLVHLDALTPAAQATQACNTIVKVRRMAGGKTSMMLVGTNTDVLGVRNALLRALAAQHPTACDVLSPGARFPPGAAAAAVIGGGATTRSAVHALHGLGLAPIFLVNRDADEVAQVRAAFASTGAGATLVHLRSVVDAEAYLGGGGSVAGDKEGEDADGRPRLAVVVGAIPAIPPETEEEHTVYAIAAYLFGLAQPAPAPIHATSQPAAPHVLPLPTPPLFLDMAYKPRDTPLLRLARARGWTGVGGVQAMLEQGLAQQRMWRVGSADDAVACAGEEMLGAEVEARARRVVEGMADVEVEGAEVDRAFIADV